MTYLDKNDNLQSKVQKGAITITEPTDRVYLNTTSPCVLHDTGNKRRITIAKTGSNTTVVWNPWESGAAKLPDLDPTEWHEFLAVETVNAAANAVNVQTLQIVVADETGVHVQIYRVVVVPAASAQAVVSHSI